MPTIIGPVTVSFQHVSIGGRASQDNQMSGNNDFHLAQNSLPSFAMHLTLPAGCRAEVRLPCGSGTSRLPLVRPTQASVMVNSQEKQTFSVVDGYVSVGMFTGGGTHTFHVDPM
jgi:hypothetical protein